MHKVDSPNEILPGDEGSPLHRCASMPNAVVVGRLLELQASGEAVVGVASPLGQFRIDARVLRGVGLHDVGAEVAVLVPESEDLQPFVIGVVASCGDMARQNPPTQLELEAQETLTLRCGKASIALHRDGRITIRGERILSRANLTNKLQGGTIQLN